MIIEQIYAYNSLRNFNYIIVCEDTKEAIVIDPLKTDELLKIIKERNYKVKAIINTHEHRDHTDGNQEIIKHTQAAVYCHANALKKIPFATKGLEDGEVINLGSGITLNVLDTPGHTMAHVCLLAKDKKTKQLALFSGDTLFNAGTGHCYHGNVDDLYNSFVNIFAKLPNETLVYPGHDYLENNLGFTISREPDNNNAKKMLEEYKKYPENKFIITTMAIEKEINTFFRLDSSGIIDNLSNLKRAESYNSKEVFIALRALRDEW